MMIYENKSRVAVKGNACDAVQQNIRLTLTRFQEGYTKRDLNLLEEFIEALFVNDSDSLIVGTADSEWCNGKEEIKNLIGSDWKYWGNVVLDIDGATVSSLGDVAWVTTEGFLHSTLTETRAYEKCLTKIKESIDSDIKPKDKMLDTLRTISMSLFDLNLGEKVVRPFRFTAVLLRSNDSWKFHNIHFSHPTNLPADVRVVGDMRIS